MNIYALLNIILIMLGSTLPFFKRLTFRSIFSFSESVLRMRREKEALLAQKIKTALKTTYVSVTDTTVGSSSCTNYDM